MPTTIAVTPDSCLKNGTCNQKCNQGRTCPRVARHAAKVFSKMETTYQAEPSGGSPAVGLLKSRIAPGATVQHVSNVRAIHPAPLENGDWLTTPGQLARTEDERTGRAATALEYFAIATAIIFTVIIAGTFMAWGRVWT